MYSICINLHKRYIWVCYDEQALIPKLRAKWPPAVKHHVWRSGHVVTRSHFIFHYIFITVSLWLTKSLYVSLVSTNLQLSTVKNSDTYRHSVVCRDEMSGEHSTLNASSLEAVQTLPGLSCCPANQNKGIRLLHDSKYRRVFSDWLTPKTHRRGVNGEIQGGRENGSFK